MSGLRNRLKREVLARMIMAKSKRGFRFYKMVFWALTDPFEFIKEVVK